MAVPLPATIREERRRSVRLSTSLLAGAAVVGALVIAPVVHAPLALAQSGECSSFPGYEQIEATNTGMYVHSDGPAKPVTMEPVGSCYKPTFVGTTVYGTTVVNVYTYYNQDDRCLYWDGSAREVYTATNANGCAAQPNEEFFGYKYISGSGWEWYNDESASDGDGSVYGYPCDNGGKLLEYSDIIIDSSCTNWNFPSDGG
jgi:hypothetical protein